MNTVLRAAEAAAEHGNELPFPPAVFGWPASVPDRPAVGHLRLPECRHPPLRQGDGMAQRRTRLGVMGGTFDPIHHGHLVAASEVAARFDLDEVVFVPTGAPSFKQDVEVTPAEHRYLMTVIATASNPRFTVSRVDIDRPGLTFTVDTCVTSRRSGPTPTCTSSPAPTPSPRSSPGRTPRSSSTWPSSSRSPDRDTH